MYTYKRGTETPKWVGLRLMVTKDTRYHKGGMVTVDGVKYEIRSILSVEVAGDRAYVIAKGRPTDKEASYG